MQLAREELEQAYRQMKTIREFEDHLHREIAKGTIGGFTHLYGGQAVSYTHLRAHET